MARRRIRFGEKPDPRRHPQVREEEIVEEEQEPMEEIVRLEEEEKPAERKRVAPLRPSQHKMRPLSKVDLKTFEELEDPESPWEMEMQQREQGTSKLPRGWFIGPAVIALLVAVFGLWMLLRSSEEMQDLEPVVAPVLVEEDRLTTAERLEQTRAEELEAERNHEELEELVQHYFAARSPEDFQGIIRHESRVMPLIRRYYKDHEFEQREFRLLEEYHIRKLRNYSIAVLKVRFRDDTTGSLLVEFTSDGPLADWESERSYQPIDPARFIEERPRRSFDFRVYAKPDHHYAYEFADEERYLSVRLDFRTGEYLNGYLEKGTSVEQEVRKAFAQTNFQQSPVLVKVRFPDVGRDPRAVIVEELVNKGWSYAESPK